MKYWINYIIALLCIGEKRPPALNSKKPVIGYGRVSYWGMSKSDLLDDLVRCATEGVMCYHIEYINWGEDSIFDFNNYNKVHEMYKYLLKICRSLGMYLFVSVTNDNLGKNGGKRLSSYYGQILQEFDFIKSCGKENVILQPVAETQTDTGKKLDTYAKSLFTNWITCYNGDGGRPSGNNGMTYRACHPSSIANCSKYKGSIITNDHSLLIKEIAENNSLSGAPDPLQLIKFVNEAKKGQAPLIVYYAFLYKKYDKKAEKAIKTLGKL